ncbi:MAG: antitoxin Xre-like helix-turn-helix domain-containing protein [Aestuariivirga sp.]
MASLVAIDRAVRAYDPSPLTGAEGAAMFRAARNLFGRWGLTDAEAAMLLDVPLRTYRRWKAEGAAHTSRDQRSRLSNLMGIHKALRIIFKEPEQGYRWIRAANEAFGGKCALEIMMRGELTDLMRVRRYLDSERGL